jgi:AcrR family transcriptional regulator
MAKTPPREAGRQRAPAEVRLEISGSQESTAVLARRFGVDPKTVRRWRGRASAGSHKPGPKPSNLPMDRAGAEAAILLFRALTALPLDDCHYALRAHLPELSRAALYRCFRRHGFPCRERPRAGEGRTLALELYRVALEKGADGRGLLVGVEPQSRVLIAVPAVAEWSEALAALSARVGHAVQRVRLDLQSLAVSERAPLRSACRAAGVRLEDRGSAQVGALLDRLQPLLRQACEADAGAGFEARFCALAVRYNEECRLTTLGGLTPAARLQQVVAASPPLRPPQIRRSARPAADMRNAMLEAARAVLAKVGPEGLSMAQVARQAGVKRATAYQHFGSRAGLIAATIEWTSAQLKAAVFGAPDDAAPAADASGDLARVIGGLSSFAMQNPEICRAWLFRVLSAQNPTTDAFWREYIQRARRFHHTPMAAEGIDAEVLSVIILAGAFLWPVWAHAKARQAQELPGFADRFTRELLRLARHGTVRSEYFAA